MSSLFIFSGYIIQVIISTINDLVVDRFDTRNNEVLCYCKAYIVWTYMFTIIMCAIEMNTNDVLQTVIT